MKRNPAFLVDENLSPLTVSFLENLGYDALRVTDHPSYSRDDEKLAKIAAKEKRILLTIDLDFGEIYHAAGKKLYGVWIFRLRDLTVESVNKRLRQFLKSKAFSSLDYSSLVILEEHRSRTRKSNV